MLTNIIRMYTMKQISRFKLIWTSIISMGRISYRVWSKVHHGDHLQLWRLWELEISISVDHHSQDGHLTSEALPTHLSWALWKKEKHLLAQVSQKQQSLLTALFSLQTYPTTLPLRSSFRVRIKTWFRKLWIPRKELPCTVLLENREPWMQTMMKRPRKPVSRIAITQLTRMTPLAWLRFLERRGIHTRPSAFLARVSWTGSVFASTVNLQRPKGRSSWAHLESKGLLSSRFTI